MINVTAATGSGTISTGRYRVKTVTDSSNVVLEAMDFSALTFSGNGTSVEYSKVHSQRVNNLTLINKVMVFLNGMLLVEDSDFFRDNQYITFDAGVNLLENHVVAIRNFGSYSTPSSTDVSNTSIEIADEGIAEFEDIDLAIKKANTTLLIAFMVIIAGAYARQEIPIAASPNVQLPFITVSVFLDGASPSDTSRLIARPLENRLKTVTGVESIRSTSSLSYARVFLEFEVGFDIDKALVLSLIHISEPTRPY